MHVVLRSLTEWNRLNVENLGLHKSAVCRSFLYLAHCATLTDEEVLDIIPMNGTVYIHAPDFIDAV